MKVTSHTMSFTSIGDCCVDIYPDNNKVFLGGSAFNVAYHAQKAGAKASLISAVGDDAYGHLFFQVAQEHEINTEHLASKEGKTSSVLIPLDEEGKPIFSGWDLGVLEHFMLTKEHEQFLHTQDAASIIFLTPLKTLFTSFCQMRLPTTFKVCDFAGGSEYSEAIDVIQQYIRNLDLILRSVEYNNQEELSFLKQLAQGSDTLILATLGAHGSIIFSKDQEYFEPVVKTNVTDTTGAGDAYLANFVVRYLQTHDIPEAMREASRAAAKVITQFGASIENLSFPG
jgi:fructoselysine 6-kinase